IEKNRADDPAEPARPPFIFYEGPPTANGLPGVHHVLARAFKDLFPRYKTMRGHRVVRKGGWDTHGLPVEVEVEKELGLELKSDIEKYGIDAFNRRCRESGNRYIKEWVEFTHRTGYWLDLDNPYVTYETPYMESVWSLLKTMWDKELLYKGYKVVPYCPRCGSPLSSHELSLGYKDDIKDPSVHPMFELDDEPGTYFLAWTTTPWTLPGNVALAVGPDIAYVKVRTRPATLGHEVNLILAEARLEVLDGEYQVLQRLTAKDLVGKTYRPLYSYLLPKEPAFFVVEADFVSDQDGTGVVHTAAAYGEDDLRLCQQKGIPVRHVVDLKGQFLPEVTKFAGMFVKDADVPIMVDLTERGLLYKKGTIRHTYPFCWRCDTPLLYYAMDSWFIRTSAYRDQLVANNQAVKWVPEHIRDGRMGNWLEGAVDWSLSRYRYWATPLPVWECETCGKQVCVGSAAELGLPPDADLHRPHIDQVTLPCPDCAAAGEAPLPSGAAAASGIPVMRRVTDLIDVWFDSGAMPYAQYHWPFEPDGAFENQFPADFICEAIDQTRGWFYSLLAISTLVSGRSSYRNVICLSHVVDAEGKKMSKTKGNVVDPMEMMDAYGADALRWYFYTAVSAGTEYRVAPRMFEEVVRRFLLILWNTYSFFVTYANLDGFTPGRQPRIPVADRPLLDRWLLAELHQTVARVTATLEDFDATAAGRAIEALVIDLSTWYVRRSRRRFWKSDSDADKLSAYQTLHESLLTVARLLAPFTPFLAEEIYGNLTRGMEGAHDSVHLDDWPEPDASAQDLELLHHMHHARRIVEKGHRQRDVLQIKVRQPLRGATVPRPEPVADSAAHGATPAATGTLLPELETIVLDELNLKSLRYHDGGGGEVVLDTEIDRELRLEGLARDLVRRVQETRKQAGLNIDDRIALAWAAPDGDVAEAFSAWTEHIAAETLATSVERAPYGAGEQPGWAFQHQVKIDGAPVWLGLRVAP
ncbi:MAG TPA: isoleucine--tRNA ligase, partial [Candidatus Dormibacteraeota bacterium]|nr:isoleucine--tRNA ligase [Candidatus Dormibacteraeota bacterium]